MKELEKRLRDLESLKTKEDTNEQKKKWKFPNWRKMGPNTKESGEKQQIVIDGCDTMGCCFIMMFRFGAFSFRQIWTVFCAWISDPLGWLETGSELLSSIQIPVISQILGYILQFLLINLVLYGIMEFKIVLGKLKTVVVVCLKLPVLWFTYNVFKFMWQTLSKITTGRAGATKETDRNTKELEKRIAELKKGSMENKVKTLETQMQIVLNEKKTPQQNQIRPTSILWCKENQLELNEQWEPYAKWRGHSESNCFTKRYRQEKLKKINAITFDNLSEACTQTSEIAEHQENYLAELEGKMNSDSSSVSFSMKNDQPSSSSGQVNAISKGVKLLKTTAYVFGEKVSDFLVDTGLEVNILPLQVVEKLGLPFVSIPEGESQVTSFDGSPGNICGQISVCLKWGPAGKEMDVEFLISPDVVNPIIGVKSSHGKFCIETLEGKIMNITEDKNVSFAEVKARVNSILNDSLIEQFPSVFSDTVVEIPAAMRKLEIKRTEFKMKGEIFGASGFSYNVERLISDKRLIQKMISEMQENGYIEKVPLEEQCHFHPLLFLPKSKDVVRLVCDLTEVNSYFVHVSGDLPRVDQVLRKIPNDWEVLAKIDLRNGFFRVPLSLEIRNYFGFALDGQRFRFTVLPQGWTLSPGLFHERVTRITSDLGTVSYVDDLLIGAPNERILKKRVSLLFERLEKYGLQVQKSKLVFGVKSVRFLGFDISSGGKVGAESYLKSKEEMIQKQISSKRELQRVLGVFNFVRSHVWKLADKTAELYKILKACPEKFDKLLSSEVSQRVREVWKLVCNDCVMVMKGQPKGKFEYHLFTDWSTSARGYYLVRAYKDGSKETVDLGSSKFHNASNLSSFLGELSTLQYALSKVKHLILGHSVVCFCDNIGAVRKLQSFSENGEDVRVSRLYAWIVENVPQVEFQYLPEQNNEVADFLSRNPRVAAVMLKENPLFSDLQIPEPPKNEKSTLIAEAHIGH
eukprot:g8724.t1